MASPPARIDKYELIRRIGHGGMGTVYLARHPELDRLVAIKLLRDPMYDEELLARFFREARAAANLRHENIITVYDVGQHEHQPFMAMEYVDGASIAEIISKREPLTLSAKLSYLEQLCSGLHFAHRAGIVHRDIKPANLMVDAYGVVRILDFGIARVEGSEMTRDGDMMGTLAYMSPEQMRGRLVDYRADIYAVGCVAYELLAYQRAFRKPDTSDNAPYVRHPDDVPQPLGDVCPGLPAELEDVVTRALATNPEDRFEDLEQARAALREIRRGIEPDLTLQPTPGRRVAEAKPPSTAGAAPDRTIVRPRPQPRDPSVESRGSQATPIADVVTTPLPAPRRRLGLAVPVAVAAILIVAAGTWMFMRREPPAPQQVTVTQPTPPPAAAASPTNVASEPPPETTPAPAPKPAASQPTETAPAPAPKPVQTNTALDDQLARINAAYVSGDLNGALVLVTPLLAKSDDERVRSSARRIAEAALDAMLFAERAATAQKSAELARATFGIANRAKTTAQQAMERGDFAEAALQALRAGASFKRAESEAVASAAPTQAPVRTASSQPVTTATAPPPSNTSPSTGTTAGSPSPSVTPARNEAAAPAAPAPVPQPTLLERERPGILATLNRYQAAYRERSVKSLSAVYPSIPRETRQALDRAFTRDCRDYDVTFGNMQLALNADDPSYATVTVRSTYTCQPKGAQAAQPQSIQELFVLRKLGDGWLIDSLGVMDTNRRQ